tara:strand:- start:357 stop:536 length:180 start_codon:yes stop_codon:yes gene_type:complete
MAEQIIRVITGKVDRDIFGSWDDCSPGLYIDREMIETIFEQYLGQRIKITIIEDTAPEL